MLVFCHTFHKRSTRSRVWAFVYDYCVKISMTHERFLQSLAGKFHNQPG